MPAFKSFCAVANTTLATVHYATEHYATVHYATVHYATVHYAWYEGHLASIVHFSVCTL